MKNLFVVLFSILFLTTFALAQGNDSDVNQTGPGNTADVNQAGTGNIADVDQSKDPVINAPKYNTVDLDQSGSANNAKINQVASGYGGMQATVKQVGDLNSADVFMKHHGIHTSLVDQLGTSNTAKVIHERNNNISTVLQNGDLNWAESRVHAGGSEVSIDQVGTNNKAYQNMGTGAPMGGGNKMVIEQKSTAGGAVSDNEAHQSMTASGFTFIDHNNEEVVKQQGNGNYSEQSITFNTGLASGNTANIRQQGSDNDSYQAIAGSGNTAETVLAGALNETIQNQTGDNNYSYVAASHNTDNNYLKSDQTGNSNMVYARIAGNNTAGSDDNNLNIDQDGNGNKSYSSVTGNNNDLDVIQNGDDNIAGTGNAAATLGIIQSGDFNTASLQQLSNSNSSTITQTGNNNSTVVYQN